MPKPNPQIPKPKPKPKPPKRRKSTDEPASSKSQVIERDSPEGGLVRKERNEYVLYVVSKKKETKNADKEPR